MKIKLIACINNVNALGKDNQLLYHLKSDLSNFKSLTMGGILIMGKNTYESIPQKPLPHRTTIIICNEEDYVPECKEGKEVYVVDSIESALGVIETFDNDNVWVVGGASIYKQFIEQDLVDTMVLTIVDDDTPGDVTFPTVDLNKYRLAYQSAPMSEEVNNTSLKYSVSLFLKR